MPAPNNGPTVPSKSLHQLTQDRLKALDKARSGYLCHWQEISSLLAPRNSRFEATDTNSGGKKHNMIWDSTGLRAHRILVAGLMAGATSPARPWFRVTTPDPDLAEYRSVKEWLDDVMRLMHTIFNRSNTYRALPKIYKQFSGYGIGASVIEPDFDTVIHHHPMAVGEYYLDTDDRGRVNTFGREFMMTAGQMVKKFGYEKCSLTVRRAYDSYEYGSEFKVGHLIEPRELTKRDVRKRDARNMPWASIYVELGEESLSHGAVLRESGYREFNVLAPRWETLGLDAYGSDCPGMTALGDIKNLQHDKKQRSKAIDYQVDPPLQAPTAMKNRESDFLPGGVSYFDATGPGAGVRTAFDVSLNLQHLREDMAELRQDINSCFYADLFLMLLNDTRSGVTAREIAERHEEKLLMLGPVLESMHNELLSPMIDITFSRMVETGILPAPPPEMEGQDLKIEFVSMLAQAQRAIGLSSVDRLIGTIGAVATGQLNAGRTPDVWDKIDLDNVVDNYADMLGIDPDLIVASDEVALVRQQRAQAQKAAALQQQMAQGAETAKTMSETRMDDADGPTGLSEAMKMFSGYGGA